MSKKLFGLFTVGLVLAMVYWSHADTVVTRPGAPITAPYLTKTPVPGLTAEEALSAKATGCLASTTSTGAVNTRTITGTTNQIAVASGDCSGNPTLSLSSTLVLPGPGVEFTETAGDATCAAGNYNLKANSTSSKIRVCQNGTLSDIGGGSSAGASGALQASNGSGGFVDSGVTAVSGVITASELNLTGGTLGSGTFLAGTPPTAPSNTNEVRFFFDSATLRWGTIANGGSAKDYLTTSDTQTVTGKTLDVEATGNVVTIQRRIRLRAARCNGTTPSLGDFELPTSGAATLACITGGNTVQGVLEFADSVTSTVQAHIKLPDTWTGVIDLYGDWRSSATAGNVVYTVRASCSGQSESSDPAWGSTNTITDAAQGTTNNQNTFTRTAISTTGCTAGEWLHLEFGRDGANGSDTITGGAVAQVFNIDVLLREAQ